MQSCLRHLILSMAKKRIPKKQRHLLKVFLVLLYLIKYHGDPSTFLWMTGLTHEAFTTLHDILQYWRYHSFEKRKRRKWFLCADVPLTFLLTWYREISCWLMDFVDLSSNVWKCMTYIWTFENLVEIRVKRILDKNSLSGHVHFSKFRQKITDFNIWKRFGRWKIKIFGYLDTTNWHSSSANFMVISSVAPAPGNVISNRCLIPHSLPTFSLCHPHWPPPEPIAATLPTH